MTHVVSNRGLYPLLKALGMLFVSESGVYHYHTQSCWVPVDAGKKW